MEIASKSKNKEHINIGWVLIDNLVPIVNIANCFIYTLIQCLSLAWNYKQVSNILSFLSFIIGPSLSPPSNTLTHPQHSHKPGNIFLFIKIPEARDLVQG